MTNDTFNFNDQGFQNDDAVTYMAAPPATFLPDDVDSDGIHLDATTNFQVGDQVTYQTSDSADTPIGGLVNGNTYTIYSIDSDGTVQLADPNNPTQPLTLTPATSGNGAQATEALVQPDIGGLQSGVTYYVVGATASSFQLAATRGGAALSLDTTGLTGTYQIGLDGVQLTPSSGTQDLHLALTGPSTTSSTGDELLSSDGTSLRLQTPVLGNGLSLAIAVGGSAGLGSGGTATAITITSPVANAYVNAQSVQADGNVSILSESDSNSTGIGANSSAGAVAIGAAKAYLIVGFTSPQISSASVGNGVQISAQGNFTLASDTQIHMLNAAEAQSGGAIPSASAFAPILVNSQTTTTVGSGAAIAANTVSITADALHVDPISISEAQSSGFAGSSDRGKPHHPYLCRANAHRGRRDNDHRSGGRRCQSSQ